MSDVDNFSGSKELELLHEVASLIVFAKQDKNPWSGRETMQEAKEIIRKGKFGYEEK